jgi:hypothetical protein
MQRDRLITSICIFAILVILLSVFKTKSNKQREGYTNYVDPVKYNHDYKLLEKNELLEKIKLNKDLKDEIIQEEIEKYREIVSDKLIKILESQSSCITAENYFENKYKYPFIPIVDNKGEPIASNYHIYEDIGDTNCSYLKIDDKLKRDKTSNLFLNINEK